MNDRECQSTQDALPCESLLITKIQEYLNKSTAYLSATTPYARGYKSGVEIAKANIANILRECGIDERYPN